MKSNENGILEIFKETGALLHGHFLLTSGRHSNMYFQCAKVLQYPEYTTRVCSIIADYFKVGYGRYLKPLTNSSKVVF